MENPEGRSGRIYFEAGTDVRKPRWIEEVIHLGDAIQLRRWAGEEQVYIFSNLIQEFAKIFIDIFLS